MLGSPNYVRFVYDGDGSATPDDPDDARPPGSDAIEKIFVDYFKSKGLASEPTPFDGRSDYGPFIAEGIPAGGSSAARRVSRLRRKLLSMEARLVWRTTSAITRLATRLTTSTPRALWELGDAAAHATLVLALSKTGLYPDGSRHAELKVTGKAAKRSFKLAS